MTKVLLNGTIVEATEINSAKHQFLGTFRPARPFPICDNDFNSFYCPTCKMSIQGSGGYYGESHWQQGHFDVPQYVDAEETNDIQK